MLKQETTQLDHLKQGTARMHKVEIKGANDENSDSFSSDEESDYSD